MRVSRSHVLTTVAGLLVFGGVYGAAVVGVAGAKASKPPVYSLANVGAYGGEASIWSDSKGELYDTTPSGGTLLYNSTTHGSPSAHCPTAEPFRREYWVVADQCTVLYLCDLPGTQSAG